MSSIPPQIPPKKVLFLLPKGSMPEKTLRGYMREHPDIAFRSIDATDPMREAEKIASEDFEIIVARGNTSSTFRKVLSNRHFINIYITTFDILRLMSERDCFGKTVAIISVRMNVLGIDLLRNILGLNILDYTHTPYDRLEQAIRDAVDKGAKLIIGGSITYTVARRMGISAHIVPVGPECMQSALDKINEARAAIHFEEARQNYVNQLLDNMVEGVVSVDAAGKVTAINKVAETLLDVSRAEILGKSVKALPPSFHEPFKVMREEFVTTIKKADYVFVKTPILQDNKVHGGIFTLHARKSVERMDHTVRTELYSHEYKAKYTFANVLGESVAIRAAVRTARKYASTNSSVLITGESGTGKEVFAQSIHNASPRRHKPFVAINCAAFPKDILPSELFGYVEGAFTGASRKGNAGLFEIANGGTIFLDEIAEMDYNTQANLLRVVQERYVMRLGSHRPIAIDCRIIAATNKNLVDMVRRGKFREDLFYRLNVLSLEIPPLRSRREDIVPLLLYFLNVNNKLKEPFTLDPQASELLQAYAWPGNIREVGNLAERLLATVRTTHIGSKELRGVINASSPLWESSNLGQPARKERRQSQKMEIEAMLAACGGNASLAARRLGIDRSTLWRRLRRATG